MHKRKLKELNLIDDFLFFTMVNHPEIGEEFSRTLLGIIFNRKFGKLTVVPQKVYYGSDTDCHGARMDVYLEENVTGEELLENATIYDLEPEQKKEEKYLRALPRRVRFYHSKIDAGSLKSGLDYENLKKVVVVMIMPFDPFGYDHMIYTIRNSCKEIPDLPYDDGAQTIFLYTRGKKGNAPEIIRQLLTYMEDTCKENVKNESLEKIHKMVETVKSNREVSKEYMKIFEREQMLLNEGIERGIEQGIERGIEQGIERGRELEKVNTQRERARAERAEAELMKLKERLNLSNKVC